MKIFYKSMLCSMYVLTVCYLVDGSVDHALVAAVWGVAFAVAGWMPRKAA